MALQDYLLENRPKGKSRTAGLALTPQPPLPTLGEGEDRI